MGRIGSALTRKIGPLPAWAWFGTLAGALIVYRRYKGQGGNSAAVAPFQQAPLTPPEQRDPVVLSSGESVYDPNSGKLLTPGGGDAGVGAASGNPPGLEGGPMQVNDPGPIHYPAKRPRLKAKLFKGSPIGKRPKLRGRKVKPIQGPRAKLKHPAHRASVTKAHVGAGRTSRGTPKAHAAKSPSTPRYRPKLAVVQPGTRPRPEGTHQVHPTTQKVLQPPKPATRTPAAKPARKPVRHR